MMTNDDVIESYVRDVARLLSRKRRNDVAYELRALLHEELAARAASAGHAPDRAMVMALLAGYGAPAQVAARYEPPQPLIDSADNHNVGIWLLLGVLVIAMDGRYGGAGVMYWLGVLFAVFAARAWWRRRHPERFAWTPRRAESPPRGARWPALWAATGLIVFPLAMYVAPQAFWDTATFGHGVRGGLTLTDAFTHSWQRMATIGWLLADIAVWLAVAVQDGWRRWSRQAGIFFGFGLGLMLLAHAAPMTTLLDRVPFAMFVASGADVVARPWFGLAGAIMVLSALYDLYQEWTRVEPAPAMPTAKRR